MAWVFLHDAASQRPETLQSVRVVLGNESCDLDSAVSAIVYAYLQKCVIDVSHDVSQVIPVLNIPKEDFYLKTEVVYFLKKCGVPLDALYFRNTIDLDVLRSSDSLELILVDHHSLSGEDIWLKPFVIEVIDHRPLDPDWPWDDVKKTIEPTGSCATLIADIAIKQKVFAVPEELLLLLYGAIILDTACLSEITKKYTPKDVMILEELEKRISPKPSREALYKELMTARCNIRSLTVSQILKKDMKVVCDLPFCSLPLLVQSFMDLNGAEQELQILSSVCQHNALVLVGVTGLDSDCRRDLAVFAEDKNVLLLLTQALMNSEAPNLQLKNVENNFCGGKLRIYNQLNTQASRKQILPIVKAAVMKLERTPSEGSSSWTTS